jgi:hypothetical protein
MCYKPHLARYSPLFVLLCVCVCVCVYIYIYIYIYIYLYVCVCVCVFYVLYSILKHKCNCSNAQVLC